MEWMLAHPWMVFWLVAKAGEHKAMHKAASAIAEMKKLEMEVGK